jgi:RNA polymerase sigma factor (sigma-70 family)
VEHELLGHWRAMVVAARQVVGSVEDAQDCAGEAIAQFLERRPDVLNLEAFLVTAAKRRAVDRVRARSRAQVREERVARQLAASLPDVAEEIASRSEASWADAEARRLLSPRSYELLSLVAQGVPVREIAARFGINEHAVQSRLLRARRTLRAGLARGLAALGLGAAATRRWLTPAGASTAVVASAFVLALLDLAPTTVPPLARGPQLALPPEAEGAVERAASSRASNATRQVARAVPVQRAGLGVRPPEATVQTPVTGVSLEHRQDGRQDETAVEQVVHCVERLRVEVGYQGCEPPP